jgi:hypothetical protein
MSQATAEEAFNAREVELRVKKPPVYATLIYDIWSTAHIG